MRTALFSFGCSSTFAALLAAGCATDPAPETGDDAVQDWHDAFNQVGVAHAVTPSDYGAGATPANPPPPFQTTANITCKPIVNGANTVVVNGKTRTFDVSLPANLSAKAAILFEWHGFFQSSTTFMNRIVYDPQAGAWKP